MPEPLPDDDRVVGGPAPADDMNMLIRAVAELQPLLTEGDHTIPAFFQAGVLEVSTSSVKWTNRSGATIPISEVYASVDDAPTGADIILDVLLDGVSLWFDPADRPIITVGTDEVARTNMDTTSIPDGSQVQTIIEQVGSMVAGTGLAVQVVS